jgi:hypothetical protein
MIFSVITQSGTKIDTLNNTIYQYSDNLTFQFLRDAKFNEYTLGAYINYDDKIYGLEVSEDDTFKVDSRFLNEKKEFLLSFSLTNGEEIIHLGTINYRVKDAFGSTTSPLPGQKEVWTVLVEQEVDDYFLKNYQSQLDDFNQKYEEIKKIAAGGGSGSSITVDSELNSTSKNPVQNKVIKAELDKKAAKNEIPTNLSSLNEDETHQTVTAEEKKKWDGKSDFDGDFNSLNNIPNIPDAVIVDAELNETSTNAIQNQAVAKELAEKLSKNGLKTINGQSLVGSGNIELSAGDNTYELPVANSETLGGVMPIAKTTEMSQGVGVDENGRLFTFPSGNSSTNSYTNIRIDKLASGTIKSGTTANTAIETGVSYDVLREYDMFEICMYGASDQGTWSIYPQGGNTAQWARISWGTGRSKVVFKKLFKDYYEPYYRDKGNPDIISITPTAPYLNTMMYKSMSYLMKLDSYYKGKTIMLLSSTDITADIAWAITACKFE